MTKTATFAFRGESITPGGLLPDKLDLFNKLKDRDIRPVVSFNAEAAFSSEGVESHDLLNESDTSAAGITPREEVGVIVNRLDRSVKLDNMPDDWRANMPPVANNNTLRSLAFRKHRVQAEILEPFNAGIPTALVESIVDVDVFLQAYPAKEYIIKPTSGTFGKGVIRVKASEVMQQFSDPESFGKMIIQPAYDFSFDLPDTIKPFDEQAREGFEAVAKGDMAKEIRMYGMHSPDATIVYPVLRGLKDGVDYWAAIDPDSVPEHVTDRSRDIIQRIAHETGSRAVYSALDIGYGSLDGGDPEFKEIEFNGRMPYLFDKEKHVAVAGILRDRLADQIAASAHAEDDTI